MTNNPQSITDIVALQQLYERQRQAYEVQAAGPDLKQRLASLGRLQQIMLDNRYRIAEAINADFGGRSVHESLLADVFMVVDDIRHARANLKRWMKPRKVAVNWQMRPSRAELRPQPLGVMGVIGAYNYPFYTALSPVVGGLAAGNRVMVKPADAAAHSCRLMQQIIADHFDASELVVVAGGLDVSVAFAKLPFDHLMFTGSTRVGREVMRAASENLVPVTLELGGKSPAIVSANVRDFDEAVTTIVHSKLGNGGQTCVAADYALVPRARVDEFVDIAKRRIAEFYPSLLNNADFTRSLPQGDRERLGRWIDQARELGGEVVQVNPADEDLSGDTKLTAPTLVWNLPDEATLLHQEVFGPVLPIRAYDTIDEVIGWIQQGERPLALYYFGPRDAECERVLSNTISGGVTVNGCAYHAVQHNLPFGGVGASGVGEYHGQAGFERFSKLKPVMYLSRFNSVAMMRPPFGKLMSWVLGLMLHNRLRPEPVHDHKI